MTPCPEDRDCPDCGAEAGELHMLGCDVERCPQCGLQLIGCGCFEDARGRIPHRLPWSGEWPGLAIVEELKLKSTLQVLAVVCARMASPPRSSPPLCRAPTKTEVTS